MLTSPAPSIYTDNSASEDRFRAALDTSPNGFCIHRPIREGDRPDGVVVEFEVPYINAAGARIVDSTPEMIVPGA